MKNLLFGLVFLIVSAASMAQSGTGCSREEIHGVFVDNYKTGTLYVNSRGSVPSSLKVELKDGTTLTYNKLGAIPGKENYKWADHESNSTYPLNIIKTYPIQGGNVYDFTIKIYDIADTKAAVLVLNCRYAFYRM